MNKWTVLEQKINRFLLYWISVISSNFKKLLRIKSSNIPKAKDLAPRPKLAVKTPTSSMIKDYTSEEIKELIKQKFLLIYTKAIYLLKNWKSSLTIVFNIINKIKARSITVWGQFKDKQYRNILNLLQSYASRVLLFTKPYLQKWINIITNIKKNTWLALGLLSLSMCIVIISGYKLIKLYRLKVYGPPPQKVAQKLPQVERPFYHLNQQKQILVENLKMPIFIKDASSIRSFIMDISIESSNRYIKAFFDKNHFYIRDRLDSTMAPVIPEFPLTEEGKDIIRHKIITEGNQLLKDLNIEGEMKHVYFHSIIAG